MIRIGRIAAIHGLKGAVVLTHIIGRSNWLKQEDILFLELNKGSYIPFFVITARAATDEQYIVSLEDVGHAEDAKKLIGKQVYVKEEILGSYVKDSPLLWIGFNVVDKNKGSVGSIQEVIQTGHQWLAKIFYEDREVLIPLIAQMILDVNVRNKFIRMDLPEGLLEL